MLALIKSNKIIDTVAEGAKFQLPTGETLMPAQANWTYNGYSLVTIVDNPSIPDGKEVATRTLKMKSGIPTFVYTYQDVTAPDRVTARQFKMQLYFYGLIDVVEEWVQSQSKAIQIAYQNSGTFVMDEPMMKAGFVELGLTDEQIKQFFIDASKL
jgi:hypothetical protein